MFREILTKVHRACVKGKGLQGEADCCANTPDDPCDLQRQTTFDPVQKGYRRHCPDSLLEMYILQLMGLFFGGIRYVSLGHKYLQTGTEFLRRETDTERN